MINVQQAEFVFNKIVAVFGNKYDATASRLKGDGEIFWDNPAIKGVICFDFIALELEGGKLSMSFGLSDLDTDEIFDIEIEAKTLRAFGLRLQSKLDKLVAKLARRNDGWRDVAPIVLRVRKALCK